ncbi:MAG: hypothetical protein PHU04_02055 [Candidatus Peribacteraceae bacterium]|nr:hypothetical protein [Candidatus Peribacteraceae bacterium]
MNDAEIRKRLNEIDCTDRRTHVEQIEAFRKAEPSLSVELVQDCTGWDDSYICHLYTFGVPQDSDIFFQKEKVFPIYPTLRHCAIFEDLEGHGLIQKVAIMQDANLVLYYQLKQGKECHIHSGKVDGQYVISKWGRGHVWRHYPQHVASVYEDSGVLRMHFYKHTDPSQTMQYFAKKARS